MRYFSVIENIREAENVSTLVFFSHEKESQTHIKISPVLGAISRGNLKLIVHILF